jgi:hypothetical protein
MTKHTQVKAKCLACGLHFVVCTWDPKKHDAKTLHCPECGQHSGCFCVWTEEVPHPIFTTVPGAAALQSVGIPYHNPEEPK